jgi:hypothetical protein
MKANTVAKKNTKKANKEPGQEYAHHDRRHEDYKYLDEDKRVTTVPIEDKIIDNNFEAPKIKIKVVTKDKEQILTDHRNRVYKVQTKSQTRAVADNFDTCQLPNNPREDEVNRMEIGNTRFEKQLEEEHKKDMTNPQERFNPVKVKIDFKPNDKVKHVEENITGKITFVGEKVSVLWDDGSRERFALSDLNQLAYVDDAETEVSPLTNQMGGTEPILKSEPVKTEVNPKVEKLKSEQKVEPKSEMDKLFEQAFDEMEDGYDDIEDANPNKLKEQALQRQVATLEKKLDDTKIANIKEKAINDMISLMKDKGIIVNDEMEKVQRETIAKMDDAGFESYKSAILSMGGNTQKANPEMDEAEKMLQRIKSGGPVIGSFDKNAVDKTPSRSLAASRDTASRDLSTLASSNISEKPNLNLEGFKDLQGLTKPIQVIAEQKTGRQSLTDAIAELDWTTLSKQF